MLTFGSLFAGIGGLDLGLERAGWTCRWQVEIDPFCRRVLAKHWPDVARYGDIRALDLERLERVELICGGFPCQPVSVAGKRLAQADARWLWPEFSRVIRALRPRLVLVENVPGLLVRGFGDVVGDLAASGYDAEWDCIPAAAVGAPHLRDRVWLVAYPRSEQLGGGRREEGHVFPAQWSPPWAFQFRDRREYRVGADGASVPDADRGRREQCDEDERSVPIAGEDGSSIPFADGWGLEEGEEFDSPQIRAAAYWGSRWRHADGCRCATEWCAEPEVGRVVDGLSNRVAQVRALGNAVVPQVAEWIGRRLMTALTDAPR